MNKLQRKELTAVIGALEDLDGTDNLRDFIDNNEGSKTALAEHLQSLMSRLESIATDEHDKFDNMPEGLQESPTGQAISEAGDALDLAVSDLDDAISELEQATDLDDSTLESVVTSIENAIANAESF